MLTYNMDVTPESVWKRTTPSEAELAQPYYCTEAGVFYAQQHFSTARTDKESYILFYTLRRATAPPRGKAAGIIIGCIWTAQGWLPWSRCCCRAKN